MKYKAMADGGLTDEQNGSLKDWLIQQLGKSLSALPGIGAGANLGSTLADMSDKQAPDKTTPLTASHETKTPVKDVPTNVADNGPDKEDRIASSHPGLTKDDLTPYIKGQEAELDKFGPDKQLDVMSTLLKGQSGFGESAMKAGAGLADAIMQGVARAGPSSFQKNIQDQEQSTRETVGNLGANLEASNLKNIQAKQALEGMSSKTPLGAADALAYEFLAKQIFPNISNAQLSRIATNPQALEKILPQGVTLADALARIKESSAYQQAMVGLKGAEMSQKEQEFIAQHPFLSRFAGMGGGGGGSSVGKLPTIASPDQYKALPSGSRYIGPDGKARVKK